ncbi:hypothetical protein C4578_02320 [Candidatus Microgenomates bacterium]|nr:MAG: hypothetical protein C4578_02320 [Candidatus Microgenomates bacterium]
MASRRREFVYAQAYLSLSGWLSFEVGKMFINSGYYSDFEKSVFWPRKRTNCGSWKEPKVVL